LEILNLKGPNSPTLCQNCIYGLGVLAQRTPQSDAYMKESLEAIDFVLKQEFPDKQD